ncbi:MAG: NAD-dependent epimerase/dehydratase family protein [Candidatus Omnitrophica bacterium]|nr:NAD-dependent epimerase/dehydratase family protein [Candidatus Omnitrophota bacterium]MBU1923662.1 NAD-dependent epimerase/dehydratase family protein [Candidatus Omnitrophota bacterium]
MSKFLVTGGAGFIGSHIVEALIKQKHYVRVLDNFSSGRIANLKGLEKRIDLIKGDICSSGVCFKAARGMDFVLHQAALRSVPKSMASPHAYNRVNIDGTLNMLEAAKNNKVKRFVFASSSSIYGQVNTFPEKESFIPEPISPYALSKLAGEYYCRIFSLHFGLSTIALRYFNVFGPRQALDDEYAVVIPKFINCLLNNQPPPIFGNGRQSRDFTFVQNVVQANLLAVKAVKVKYGVFNVAGGKDTTILGLVKILNKILGKDILPLLLSKRPGDVFRTLADIKASGKILKFRPVINFVNGLKITVDYWKQNA